MEKETNQISQINLKHYQNPPPVLTKRDFVRRYKLGEFGNASMSWEIDEWLDEYKNYPILVRNKKLYHLRNKRTSGDTFCSLTERQLLGRLYGTGRHRDWRNQEKDEDWYISEMAPHQYNVLQGEAFYNVEGLELFVSTEEDLAMRDALFSSGKRIKGVFAKLILQYLMPDRDRFHLYNLLERYKDHVVEFSTFSVPWGTVPGFRTVYWEVRKY